MLLLRGGVPRRNSFPTVVGEQPSSLAMALFESPCRLRYWIAPLSSRPRCCPFLRSAATVIYCVQSIVIALLLVNVVWELHSTIRVKSLWIFFSQVSNFIMQSTKKFIPPAIPFSNFPSSTIFLLFFCPFRPNFPPRPAFPGKGKVFSAPFLRPFIFHNMVELGCTQENISFPRASSAPQRAERPGRRLPRTRSAESEPGERRDVPWDF